MNNSRTTLSAAERTSSGRSGRRTAEYDSRIPKTFVPDPTTRTSDGSVDGRGGGSRCSLRGRSWSLAARQWLPARAVVKADRGRAIRIAFRSRAASRRQRCSSFSAPPNHDLALAEERRCHRTRDLIRRRYQRRRESRRLSDRKRQQRLLCPATARGGWGARCYPLACDGFHVDSRPHRLTATRLTRSTSFRATLR